MAMVDALLRRERLILLAGIGAIVALAWAWLLSGAGMQMSALEMTAMAAMDGWLMQPALWSPAYALLVFSMWWVMMLAMMLPGAVPMLLLFARVNRKDRLAGPALTPTLLFACGYLIVWGGFSVAATALQWGLESVRAMSPMLVTTRPGLGAAILLAAGLWQLTPLKAMCLRHCQTPIGFLVGHWRAGLGGALRMGLAHGGYCLGCCWFLMALLFFGGVMNLYWIVGLSVYVLLEKTWRHGQLVARLSGVGLIGWGLALGVWAF